MQEPEWTYFQARCDAPHVVYLCENLGRYGWEPVFIFESHRRARVPVRTTDLFGPKMRAKRPYEVLFRRPLRKPVA